MVTVKGEVATVMAAVAMVTEGVAGNERLSEAQSLTASGSYVETLETAHRDQVGWRWGGHGDGGEHGNPSGIMYLQRFL